MASNALISSQYVPLAGVVTNPKTQQMGDNSPTTVLMNRQGDLVVSEYRGKYGAAAVRGALFKAALTTAAGTIAVITTTSAATWTLVNPVASGINIEPVDFQMDFLDTNAAPTTANVVGFSFVNIGTNAISGITKCPVPTGGLGGSAAIGGWSTLLSAAPPTGYVATVITYASALTVAANWGYPMFSFPASWVPTVGGFPVPLVHNFDGKLILPPGYAMSLVASTAWGANTVVPSISWMEHLT